MRHVLSILVRNQSGVLVRVASMFSRREFNIDSLSVGVTETAEFSRITVVVHGDEELIDQMMKQLEKLPDVVEVQALLSAAPIPDPEIERKRQRIILSGDVPSPAEEHTGCYFYDRCPKRKEHCKDAVPPLEERGEGHRVACFEV